METNLDNGIHWVYITDESGMATVFPQLKAKLVGKELHHVSVVYYAPTKVFHFQRELEILLRHYPTVLFVYFIIAEVADNFFQEHPELESIINANTMTSMEFVVCGSDAFCLKATELLHFLDIQQITIQNPLFI
ncbi:hypothetical protein [Flectobacillus major]|jgi:ferredoxin-NADP reductase|uniref:hypothetical protein n=1 Tax=Flectobacillus major TaxID=103 RepID=UPI0004030D3C|nr:hypothetical protein [Flectobacillus major]